MSQSTALSGKEGLRAFMTLWIGEVVSILGTGLSAFAAGIWVYQRTGSVTSFSLISLVVILPSFLFSPFAGALVDRWDRRRIMVMSNLGQCFITSFLALLLFAGRLEYWHIYVVGIIASILALFNKLAFETAITSLLSAEDFGRASGLMQIGPAAAQILSPLIAGGLLALIRFQGLLLIDSLTFLFAIGTLFMVRIPPRVRGDGEAQLAKTPLYKEATFGWSYIARRRGLLGLLAFFALINFVIGLSGVTLTPLLMGFTSPQMIAVVAAVSSTGMLLGSIAMGIWGGPKRPVYGVLGFGLILGLGFIVIGWQTSIVVIVATGFLIQFVAPAAFGSNQAIWLSKTPAEIQGRVFAVRTMVQSSIIPLAYIAGGPLADRVFSPLLVAGGPWAGTIGRLLGVGPNRGIGLMLVVMGLLTVLVSAAGYVYSPLRQVDTEVPDVTSTTAGQIVAEQTS